MKKTFAYIAITFVILQFTFGFSVFSNNFFGKINSALAQTANDPVITPISQKAKSLGFDDAQWKTMSPAQRATMADPAVNSNTNSSSNSNANTNATPISNQAATAQNNQKTTPPGTTFTSSLSPNGDNGFKVTTSNTDKLSAAEAASIIGSNSSMYTPAAARAYAEQVSNNLAAMPGGQL